MSEGSFDILFRDETDSEFAKVNTERAVSELRYGRSILLHSGAAEHAVLSIDAAAPGDVDRFFGDAPDEVGLYLSAHRARALGISTIGPVCLTTGTADLSELSRIAFGAETRFPGDWRPASELACLNDLARLALLLPAFLVRPARADDRIGGRCLSVADAEVRAALVEETRFTEIVRTAVPLRDISDCRFVVFRGGLAQRDQLAIMVGEPDLSRPVPVRIHSSCITGDLFGSLKCDCGDQLRNGLQLIAQRGGGVLLYLDQEGRGTGLAAKMRAYGLQHEGFDTIDADAQIGFEPDGRRYGAAVAMLRSLGIGSVELMTNNPTKIAALQSAGIEVQARTAVLGTVTAENQGYLVTKARRAGHLLDWPAIAAKLG